MCRSLLKECCCTYLRSYCRTTDGLSPYQTAQCQIQYCRVSLMMQVYLIWSNQVILTGIVLHPIIFQNLSVATGCFIPGPDELSFEMKMYFKSVQRGQWSVDNETPVFLFKPCYLRFHRFNSIYVYTQTTHLTIKGNALCCH